MGKRIVGATMVICAALGLPAAAGALPTWGTPSSLSQAGALFANAAMGAHGDAAMVWASPAEKGFAIQIATRAPFGSFSPASTLSPAGAESLGPQVAEDAAGEATAVWFARTGSAYIVEAATVASGIPSAPVQLSAPGQDAIWPTVAVNERGAAIVAWTRSNGGAGKTLQVSFRPAGGSFGAPVSLTPEGGLASLPKVAIDAAGDATVVWEQAHGSTEVIEEATRPTLTGTFTKAAALSTEAETSLDPSVAMDAAGDTAVAWTRINATGGAAIQATVRPAGGKFSAPANLTGEAYYEEDPQVTLDGHGNPTVVWTAEISGFPIIDYASGTSAGVFSDPQSVAAEAAGGVLAEDPAGDTLIGYANIVSNVAEVTFRPAGGAFGAAQAVSPAGGAAIYGVERFLDEEALSVAMDGGGDGMFGYVVSTAEGYFAQAALLDTAGVGLEKASIPTSATAGAPVSFSVEPRDQVFAKPTVTWSFGDASTASGDAVTHTFADPGTYSVSVTAVAAPGDSATQTATVTVLAPPKPSVPAFAAATLGSTAVTADRHGRVSLRVACPAGGAACAGTVTLTLPATASGLAVAARVSGMPVTVAAGQASFGAAAGSSTAVSVALPAVVLRLLGRHHRLTLTAIVESHGASSQGASTSGKVLVKAYTRPSRPKRHKQR